MIRLGQLLQHAGIADSGGEARRLLAAGEVTVGGEPEQRRGRQLHPGDVVAVGDEQLRVVSTGRPPDPGPALGDPDS